MFDHRIPSLTSSLLHSLFIPFYTFSLSLFASTRIMLKCTAVNISSISPLYCALFGDSATSVFDCARSFGLAKDYLHREALNASTSEWHNLIHISHNRPVYSVHILPLTRFNPPPSHSCIPSLGSHRSLHSNTHDTISENRDPSTVIRGLN